MIYFHYGICDRILYDKKLTKSCKRIYTIASEKTDSEDFAGYNASSRNGTRLALSLCGFH